MHCPPPPDKAKPEGLRPLDRYAVYVGFDQIADGEKYLGKDRDWYLNLPTSFVLPADRVDTLRGFAQRLLDKPGPYRDLAKCLQTESGG